MPDPIIVTTYDPEWPRLFAELGQRRIYPSVLKEWLPKLPAPERRYLGDVN